MTLLKKGEPEMLARMSGIVLQNTINSIVAIIARK